MSMDWFDGIELINKAIEKELEQKDWEVWLSIYPKMNQDNFIPFEKFKSKNNKSDTKKESKKLAAEEIIERAENMKSVHQGTHKGLARKEAS